MNETITLWNPQQAHSELMRLWTAIKPWSAAGHRLTVRVKSETRSLAQNARMWAMLGDVSRQVDWHGMKLSPEDWKTMFTASLKKQRVVPGIDGGFVVMGDSTSNMTIAEMGDLMELMSAFGAERDVRFTAPEAA
tara:strand:+ start:830 stop:1234 length:405 start_codon:yes stop_codon:yes gene_type:complete